MRQHLFYDDYSEGAHPRILEALQRTNLTLEPGYGEDSYSKEAVELIKNKLQNENVDVHFVSGGTQANLVVIGALLKPYQCVIAAEQAHINVHEAGGVEAIGHKIITQGSKEGKLDVPAIEELVELHCCEHRVKPKVVFLSNATELGTIYGKGELEEISR